MFLNLSVKNLNVKNSCVDRWIFVAFDQRKVSSSFVSSLCVKLSKAAAGSNFIFSIQSWKQYQTHLTLRGEVKKSISQKC